MKTHVPSPDHSPLCSEYRCNQDLNWTQANYIETCIEDASVRPTGELGQMVLNHTSHVKD